MPLIDNQKQSEEGAIKEPKDKHESTKKDVQQLLDEMMIQTMKETEQQNEVDSDLSGTEKVEEVILKEDNDVNDTKDRDFKDDKNELKTIEDKKIKPTDSETDTENKKVSNYFRYEPLFQYYFFFSTKIKSL